jgi:hypothetical protein
MRHLTLTLLLTGCFHHPRQLPTESEEFLELPCDFQAGESLSLMLHRRREDSRKRTPLDGHAMHIPVELELLPSEGDPIVRWSYGAGSLDEGVVTAEELVALRPLLEIGAFAVEFELNQGMVGEVRNLEDVAEMAARALNVIAQLDERDTSPEFEAAVQEMMRQPAMLQMVGTRDLEPYFEPVCATLPLSEPIVAPVSLPNPLGGPDIVAEATFEIASVDPAERRATMSWHIAPQSDALGVMVEHTLATLMQQLGGGNESEMRAALSQMTFENRVEGHAIVDTVSGWPLDLKVTRSMRVELPGQASQTRYDEWHYELLEQD